MSKINNLHFIYKRPKSISKDSPLIITNDSDDKKRAIFVGSFKCKNDAIKIVSQLSQTDGQTNNSKLLLLNSRFRYIQTVHTNGETVISNLRGKTYRLGIVIPPRSSVCINELSIDVNAVESEITKDLLDTFNGDTLLIAPGYPSDDNLYNHTFVHSRMKLYEKSGINNIDVAVVNDQNINQSFIYEFDNVRVNSVSYSTARLLLQQKKYKQIYIHFFNQKHAQILDASDTSNTQIFIYTHGGDVLYRDYPDIARRYFKNKAEITESLKKNYDLRDSILRRYNEYENVHWIFATKWTKDRAEMLLGTSFNRAKIIPNPISSEIFAYKERVADDRKKICLVRPFNKHSSYSIDISVRVILELSKRPFFEELEFNIYGTGETHEMLTRPIAGLSNVKIHNTFLNSNELSNVFQQHGIVLMPTRYDTQGVSACEAAMTGAVVISSDSDVGLKECVDPSLGTYCKTESIKEYADVIEKLYNNKGEFLKLSKKMHDFTFNACSEKFTIDKEVKLISNTKPFEKALSFKPKDNTPLLTIAVPAYNVEKYLLNGVLSLIDHPLAHKLEILIVNDGSKDDTARVGLTLEKMTKTKNGPIVKIINKNNGGHGSTINKGVELAKGKYFRLMDGDDYFITSELVALLEKLENETSDIVLTNYIEDFSIDAIKHPVHHYDFMTPGLQYDLDTMHYEGYGFGEWGPLLSTTTCRTDILKKANFKINENCFYVDMEYNFIIYALSKTVTYYPLDVYNYYLGRAGQSMTRDSFTRNVLHHEKVTVRLLEEYYSRKDDLSNSKKSYIVNKLMIPMCKTQYMITTDYLSNNESFLSFDKKLKKYKEFYYDKDIAGRFIRLHRATNGHLIKIHSPMKKISSIIKQLVGIR